MVLTYYSKYKYIVQNMCICHIAYCHTIVESAVVCADFGFIEDQMEMFHNVLLNAIINTIATYYRVGGELKSEKKYKYKYTPHISDAIHT